MAGESERKVRKFWDEQAEAFGADPSATLTDHYLRGLEIATIQRYIRERNPKRVVDIGCGNGFSTVQFAAAFSDVAFVGVDYSREMIRHARDGERPNCAFLWGDVLDPATLPDSSFDVVLTQRCIQNILDRNLQTRAIRNMLTLKSDDGVLLLMECSKPGLRQFNRLSQGVNPHRPPKREPFHNLWLEDRDLRREFGAHVEYFCSTYMIGKAIHPRLQRICCRLPQVGAFGYDRLFIIR
ncbi:hypothetical protein BH18GEM1_BH18GEM1_01500 [soil metagenome]